MFIVKPCFKTNYFELSLKQNTDSVTKIWEKNRYLKIIWKSLINHCTQQAWDSTQISNIANRQQNVKTFLINIY
jgi:hypothetical protein